MYKSQFSLAAKTELLLSEIAKSNEQVEKNSYIILRHAETQNEKHIITFSFDFLSKLAVPKHGGQNQEIENWMVEATKLEDRKTV